VSAVFSPQPSQRRLVTYGGAGGSYLLGVGPHGRAFGYPFSDGQAWSAGRVIRSQLRRRRLRPGFLFWGHFLLDLNKASPSGQKLIFRNHLKTHNGSSKEFALG